MKITSTQCQYPGTLERLVYSSTGSCYFDSNHHGAEISVISLVEWSAIKLLILMCYQGKADFEVQINFNVNTTLVAFFKIRLSSLYFDMEKRRQCSEVTAIP